MSFHPPVRAVPSSEPVPPLHFDPTFSDSLRRRVQPHLSGLPSLQLKQLPGAVPDDARPTVAFFDGKLGTEHASLLRRPRPVLLCAQREDGLPSAWELDLLSAVLTGRALPAGGAHWHHLSIKSVASIGEAAALACTRAEEAGAGASVAKLASDVTHELLANALLDAPVDATGAVRYANRRDAAPIIAPEDFCTFGVAASKERIVLAASDRFGRLTVEPVARVVEGYGGKVQTDTRNGGAGIGMRLIVEHCDAVVFRVVPGRSTEALGVILLDGPRRRASQPKSLFFFQTASDARGGTA